jgi:hypothetical protein
MRQGPINMTSYLYPPYGGKLQLFMKKAIEALFGMRGSR